MKKKRNSKAKSIYRNINKNKKINKNIRLNNNDMIDGTLSVTRKGFGFVTPLGETDNSKDVFVPAKSLGGAFDGDLVRIPDRRRRVQPWRRSAICRRQIGRASCRERV